MPCRCQRRATSAGTRASATLAGTTSGALSARSWPSTVTVHWPAARTFLHQSVTGPYGSRMSAPSAVRYASDRRLVGPPGATPDVVHHGVVRLAARDGAQGLRIDHALDQRAQQGEQPLASRLAEEPDE